MRLIPLVVALALAGTACTKVRAHTEPVMPELAPPPPPPRVIEAYPEEPASTTDDTATETTANVPVARPAVKPPAPKPAETPAKPDVTRTEPERPATQPPALRLVPPPGSTSQTEASIRDLLNRATRDLNRVNYGALNSDGKAQYDTTKRFIQQAEEALRGGNLVFAGKFADKAATMASVLVR